MDYNSLKYIIAVDKHQSISKAAEELYLTQPNISKAIQMIEKELKFTVTYGKHTFTFEQGSKAYIFHTGVYNDIDKKYGIKSLLEYVDFVHDCYIEDSNRTPLGSLGDYIAAKWKTIKNKSLYDVLEKFYAQEIY